MSSNIRVRRICHNCENEFEAKKTTSKTCSDTCAKKLYKLKQKEAKVAVSNNETFLIKAKPFEDLKLKEFLSIEDTSKLLGISRRTIYRLLQKGNISAGKAGRRTLIKRSELEKLFSDSDFKAVQPENKLPKQSFDISNSYTLTEVQNKFGISETALHDLINRNHIPKVKKGWYTYVPKTIIEEYLNR